MKSKFALSFGISLIFVGILNIFLETSSVILFGLSVSTLLFSLISIAFTLFVSDDEDNKLEFIYIIPFVILLSIFCYSNSLMKLSFISNIVNSNFLNVLTFISFGLLFISEYINYKISLMYQKINIYSIIIEAYDYSNLILESIIDYRKELIKNKIIIDEQTETFLDKIEDLCNEKTKKAKIEAELLKLEKDYYTVEDFDKIYTKNNEKLNHNYTDKKSSNKKGSNKKSGNKKK